MCYTEYTTKTYGCGATTGSVNPNVPGGAGVLRESTTKTVTCSAYTQASRRYELYKEQQWASHQPFLSFNVWTVRNGTRVCGGKKVYWATWITNRQCRSGFNGEGICEHHGTYHLYTNAPGVRIEYVVLLWMSA